MSDITNELLADARERMKKSVEATAGEFGSVRNVRRDVMHDLRELKEGGDIGADDEHRAEVELQKLTDERVHELDGVLKAKEAEILEV